MFLYLDIRYSFVQNKVFLVRKGGYTYILRNINRTTLYVSVTSDLVQQLIQHKSHLYKNSFTSKHNVEYCIYCEEFPTIIEAINREKEIKKWSKYKKELLINKVNPELLEIDFNQGKTKISFKDEVTKILDEILKENKEKE